MKRGRGEERKKKRCACGGIKKRSTRSQTTIQNYEWQSYRCISKGQSRKQQNRRKKERKPVNKKKKEKQKTNTETQVDRWINNERKGEKKLSNCLKHSNCMLAQQRTQKKKKRKHVTGAQNN